MKSYSLYIHIPFCQRKCAYCDFVSYAYKDYLIPSYIKALEREINYYAAALPYPYIRTIYFGGGTPSLLEGKQIVQILEFIYANFKVAPEAEISLEANPGTIDLEKLKILKGAGINRLSLGAQSFDDRHLKRLGRLHKTSQIYEAFEVARKAGFDNINLDLIFALPDQTLKDWQKTLRGATALEPTHLSTYNLQIEEGTPLWFEKENLNLADEELELNMYKEVIHYLTSKGYKHYEISNFARSGKKCLHNITYWKHEEYIGLGAGSHSYINGQRYANPNSIEEYLSPYAGHLKDQGVNEMAEAMFLGLRLLEGISREDFKHRFGLDIQEVWDEELAELVDEGLVTLDNLRLKLTSKGLLVADKVFEKFV